MWRECPSYCSGVWHYLDGEFHCGEQVDEFVECEFVDIGLEELGHPRAGEMIETAAA